ncbi:MULTISPECIES: ATP-binding protein [unclassified Rhizobium]|uniref:ATP-binding protein n=1 Tax=unclassified Rhizobium TaxID=2613769 RepID=UPI001ADB0DBC|nr:MULTISPECIES: ATP-binding protein [unclassified Rhizobium]MBO9102054.1 ATP-binding protein [Rhizobium sp. L58/93]MBO9172140.1 ATP-binding protein [Rhizobium sp. L245/93]QXZ88163.1 ATP-binding protein [Rhizobium sp. K1/93]QXZ94337.1 ATP-binding protein [Rhizobium sp. K15/93]QYA05769.1 ATP-binding protein [Rhizobium sp. B21/90]
MDTERSSQGILFDDRFLDKYAGPIISDPAVAIVELAANAWDAYATKVDIVWPNRSQEIPFSITDNGKGMTPAQFERRWKTLDYNRLADEGTKSAPPADLPESAPRIPYGRNGKGRHAAFKFSDPYRVRTWRDGVETVYEVRRGLTQPFDVTVISSRDNVSGHGTEIVATTSDGTSMDADTAREIIGTRFLADPNFVVTIDGTLVSFDDIPTRNIQKVDVDVPGFGAVQIVMIDSQKADRTTRQHGIAWRVNSRLVGNPGWVGFDHERVLDGRSTEAKRFQFIVSADILENAVQADWSGFLPDDQKWQATRLAVHAQIKQYLSTFSADRRREAKLSVKQQLVRAVRRMPPVGRERWNQFVDEVIDNCPSISTEEVGKVASILANLELSTSKFSLLGKLNELEPGDLDALYDLLDDWTLRLAKDALDEIQTRLKLIEDLDKKLRDETMDEVGDLQPLFARSLWVFGPEFESLEFTSNKGMTEVIRKIFGSTESGSRQRPDFVMLPDGSVGLYSRDAHDIGHEVDGVSRLVVAEIKKPGVGIGSEQKDQAWRYVKELRSKGLLNEAAVTTCYILGSKIDIAEGGNRTEWDGRVTIIPITYNTFIRRAEKRMLGLREKLKEAPFLKDHGVDGDAFVTPPVDPQRDLLGAASSGSSAHA